MFQKVCKIDAMRQIVTGEVYAPNQIDSHGEMMLGEDVEKLCHRFMQLQLGKSIDTTHDNKPIDAFPIENFIARNHPEYSEGAWVLSVKINDAAIWESVLKGEFNGYSWQAMVYKDPVLVETVGHTVSFGMTEANKDHQHFFIAHLDANGRVCGGKTSEANGHTHVIKSATATEKYDDHSHRFFLQ